jgi:hypothetical protein
LYAKVVYIGVKIIDSSKAPNAMAANREIGVISWA